MKLEYMTPRSCASGTISFFGVENSSWVVLFGIILIILVMAIIAKCTRRRKKRWSELSDSEKQEILSRFPPQ